MTTESEKNEGFVPKILVFSTDSISDPGIDLAGSSHIAYPSTVSVISLPCSSGIKPKWILHAIEKGFDGVFIAADGTDCPFLTDCTDRTAKIADEAQNLLKEKGYSPQRVKMGAICSVCAEPFAAHMNNFFNALKKIGPVTAEGSGNAEG